MLKNKWKWMGMVVVLTSLLAACVIPFVMAQGEEIVCTVTTGVYSVTLDDYDIAYGSMTASAEKTSGTINATNNGGLTEDLLIYGSDATGPSGTPAPTWNIGPSPDIMIYRHTFNVNGETSLTEASKTLKEDVTAGQKVGFTLKLYTPTTISTHGEYTFYVTVMATAPS